MLIDEQSIRELTEALVREYRPQRIILFGSRAKGTGGEGSDVDLLVIMRFEGHSALKAAEVLNRIRPRIPVDLLVRTPEQVRQRLEWNDFFLRDVVEKGKVLYESSDPWVGSEGGGRFRDGQARTSPNYDAVCFHGAWTLSRNQLCRRAGRDDRPRRWPREIIPTPASISAAIKGLAAPHPPQASSAGERPCEVGAKVGSPGATTRTANAQMTVLAVASSEAAQLTSVSPIGKNSPDA